MQQNQKTGVAFILLSMMASMALNTVGFLSFLFPLPLLLLRKRGYSTERCLWIQAVTFLGILAYNIYPYFGFFQPENYGIIAFGLIFTLISALETMIFTAMEEKSSSLLRKLVVATVPAFVLGGAFVFWITSPLAEASIAGFKGVVEAVVNENMPEMLQLIKADVILTTLIILTVPMAMILSGLPIVISEFVLKSHNEDFQENLAYMKMPGIYSVLLLICVLMVVPAYIVEDYPMMISSLGCNFTAGLLLHFAVNGCSIVYAAIKKRSQNFSAGRVLFLLICAGFIPGLNFGLFAGLVIVAILENWIKFR